MCFSNFVRRLRLTSSFTTANLVASRKNDLRELGRRSLSSVPNGRLPAVLIDFSSRLYIWHVQSAMLFTCDSSPNASLLVDRSARVPRTAPTDVLVWSSALKSSTAARIMTPAKA